MNFGSIVLVPLSKYFIVKEGLDQRLTKTLAEGKNPFQELVDAGYLSLINVFFLSVVLGNYWYLLRVRLILWLICSV